MRVRGAARSLFEDPYGELYSMIVEVQDAGNAAFKDESYLELRNPAQIQAWAEVLIRRWRKQAPSEFVVPIMWDRKLFTFWCPLEESWRKQLSYV